METTGIFFETIPDEIVRKQLLQADERFKFASVYVFPTVKVEWGLPIDYLAENISLENLYAFDNFIRNGDRGERKTNMIRHTENSEIFLIDHEMAFDITPQTTQNFEKGQWEVMFTTYHFAYNYLQQQPSPTFYEFEEYVNTLNLKKLEPIFRQLEQWGFDTKEDLLTEYLFYMKKNIAKFIALLQKTI